MRLIAALVENHVFTWIASRSICLLNYGTALVWKTATQRITSPRARLDRWQKHFGQPSHLRKIITYVCTYCYLWFLFVIKLGLGCRHETLVSPPQTPDSHTSKLKCCRMRELVCVDSRFMLLRYSEICWLLRCSEMLITARFSTTSFG